MRFESRTGTQSCTRALILRSLTFSSLHTTTSNEIENDLPLTSFGHYVRLPSYEGTGPHPGDPDLAGTRASQVTAEKMTWRLCFEEKQTLTI